MKCECCSEEIEIGDKYFERFDRILCSDCVQDHCQIYEGEIEE